MDKKYQELFKFLRHNDVYSFLVRQLCGLATFTWEKGCRPTWLRLNTSRPKELHRAQRKSSPSSKWRTPSQWGNWQGSTPDSSGCPHAGPRHKDLCKPRAHGNSIDTCTEAHGSGKEKVCHLVSQAEKRKFWFWEEIVVSKSGCFQSWEMLKRMQAPMRLNS